jgi:hypothetical protein
LEYARHDHSVLVRCQEVLILFAELSELPRKSLGDWDGVLDRVVHTVAEDVHAGLQEVIALARANLDPSRATRSLARPCQTVDHPPYLLKAPDKFLPDHLPPDVLDALFAQQIKLDLLRPEGVDGQPGTDIPESL